MVSLKAEMLQKLLDVSREMVERRVLDPLLRYAMQVALELVDGEMGYLILLANNDALEFRVKLDRHGNEVDQPIRQISQSILKRVIQEREDVILANAVDDDAYRESESVVMLRLRSVMAVPLIVRETVLGALYVENRSERGVFTREDLNILKFFGGQAASAIENAILYDELETRVQQRTAELRAANRRLEERWHEVVELNRMRSDFLSAIAHDIRSPLGTVLSAQNMLAEGIFGELNEDQQEWVNTSVSTIQHVLRLTDDFFDLTKLELGQLSTYKEKVDTNAFLKEIRAVGRAMHWPEGVAFATEIEEDLPVLVFDRTRIRQVLINLISNAQKFTDTGTVTLYAHHVDGGVRLGVRDTGIGIDLDDLEVIFQPYQQVGPLDRRHGGSGLGLAISQELVMLHGGEIVVESSVGQGSDFHFVLSSQAQGS